MNKSDIHRLLMHDLKLAKEPVALKPLREIPPHIQAYEGVATPGLCAQISEILQDRSVFYSTRKNHVCYEGLIATGVCALDRQDYRRAVEEFIDLCPYHRDVDTAMDFYETCIREIPPPPVAYACLVSGPLSKVDDPDLVLIFCTPRQAEMLIRAQAYDGKLVQGFGGNGGCLFNIRRAFVTRQMTFSTSDFPWRTFAGLDDSELTVTVPYERLMEAAPHIKPIIAYVYSLKDMFGG